MAFATVSTTCAVVVSVTRALQALRGWRGRSPVYRAPGEVRRGSVRRGLPVVEGRYVYADEREAARAPHQGMQVRAASVLAPTLPTVDKSSTNTKNVQAGAGQAAPDRPVGAVHPQYLLG